MSDKKLYTRRRLLATAAATTVAGCTSGGEDGSGTETTVPPSTTGSVTDTRTTTTTATTTQQTETVRGTVERGVEKLRDVPFRETPQRTLELDLYLPTSGSDHPFFIFAHGGAWVLGDKGERPMFEDLATNGYAVADIQYRLALDEDRKYPIPVRDITAAVKWVKANAREYEVDATTGALAGYSAGAHLAALVGLAPEYETFQPVDFYPDVSASVETIVGYSGPYDFTVQAAGDSSLVERFFGENATDETLAEGSPVTHVDSGDSSALLLHGTEDGLVPYRSTTVLADALREANVPVEVFSGEGAGHGMINSDEWRDELHATQRAFLDDQLRSA